MLCPFNPAGAYDVAVVSSFSLVAVVPSGAFCFHLGGRVAAHTAAAGVLGKGIRLWVIFSDSRFGVLVEQCAADSGKLDARALRLVRGRSQMGQDVPDGAEE